MKKIILIFAVVMVFVACKKSQTNKDIEETQNVENRNLEKEEEYTKIENTYDEMKIIFSGEFSFADEIIVDEIGVLKMGDDTYKIAYFLNDSCNFNKIEELNIAFRVYPKNPELFAKEFGQNNKAKTFAAVSNISVMDDIKVIVSNEFKISPKEFKSIKVYFYDPKAGVSGRMMTILDVKIP